MTRSASRRFLPQLFESCEQALYLVDNRHQIAYINPAARSWLGDKADALIGTACVGAQEGATIDPVAAALAPPPGCLEGQTITVSVHWSGGPSPVPVRFTPIGVAQTKFVIAEVNPPRNTVPPTESHDLQMLRAQVNRLRSRQPRIDQWLPLLGETPRIVHARRQLQLAATSFVHVSLVGATGCGYDRLARHLHALSGESGGSFISIDAPLMDNDLLDLIAGPAIQQLEDSRTSRATLLLRDANELAGEPAAKLQSWLERFSGRLRCISTSTVPLIGSANRPTELSIQMALALSTIRVEIPPLTERVEDIPLLAAAMLTKRQSTGATAEGFYRTTLDLFVAYPWPKDVLELEEAVRHASRACLRGVIQLEHLPLQIRSWRPHASDNVASEKAIELDRVLANIEAELIKRALNNAKGNKSEAAKRLSISRAKLLRRINELNIATLNSNTDSSEVE